MRVLQVSKFFPPVLGGIESAAWELTEGLGRAGHEVEVLCSHHRWPGLESHAEAGYRVTRVGSLGRILSTSMAPTMPWQLARRRGDFDIVHLHMPDPMAGVAYLLGRPGGRLVLHWHSDVVRQRQAMRLYAPLQDWLLRRADAVIATSQPYADSSPALRPWRAKVHVIPIGISDDTHRVDATRVAAIRHGVRGRRIVFALGRMTYYKGFEHLVEAAALLPDDIVVRIGGDGEMAESLRVRIARQGLAGKVQLIGHVPDHELADHFEACDLFCMPSTLRAEAYGVAMLEAMVHGKPVVASAIEGSGVPWVNQHGITGYNVRPADPAALAQAIRGVLDDPDQLRAMGQAARHRYLHNFTSSAMTAATLELYERLRTR
jgi:glycosyltransferase involved in cell wall biosynthesis